MNSIKLQNLEEVLNSILLNDAYEGRRPAVVVAQLYYQTNNVTNTQVTEISGALEALAIAEELDKEYNHKTKTMLYFSQKFGSKKDEYMQLLEDAVVERELIQDQREALSSAWNEKQVSFFDKDAQWYFASSDCIQ